MNKRVTRRMANAKAREEEEAGRGRGGTLSSQSASTWLSSAASGSASASGSGMSASSSCGSIMRYSPAADTYGWGKVEKLGRLKPDSASAVDHAPSSATPLSSAFTCNIQGLQFYGVLEQGFISLISACKSV